MTGEDVSLLAQLGDLRARSDEGDEQLRREIGTLRAELGALRTAAVEAVSRAERAESELQAMKEAVERADARVGRMEDDSESHLGDCLTLAEKADVTESNLELVGRMFVAVGRVMLGDKKDQQLGDAIQALIDRLHARVSGGGYFSSPPASSS